jgi:hypothetical protein
MMRRTALAGHGILALLLAAPGLAPAAAGDTDLADLDARIEYTYYAGDLRALEYLLQEHDGLAAEKQPWAAYQYAHAQFRRARLLSASGNAQAAQAAARRCVEALAAPAPATPDPAEEKILVASCEAYAGHMGSGASDRALAAAAKLAPANPRLLLARAFRTLTPTAATAGPALRQQQLTAARAAAAAFTAPTVAEDGAPSWGAADAWLLVGSRAEALGDWLAAREAYERCLVLAPDYALARSRLRNLRERAQ